MGIFRNLLSRRKATLAKKEARRLEILIKIRNVFAKELGINPEEVQPASRLQEDLGINSLETIKLVMAFEEAFNIEIPDEDTGTVLTVKEIVDYLEKRVP